MLRDIGDIFDVPLLKGWKLLCANNFKNQNHETKEKKKKDNVTTISLLQKYFGDSHNLCLVMYTTFSMSLSELQRKKEKRK